MSNPRRYVLFGKTGQPAALAEAPSKLDAELFALRNPQRFNGKVTSEADFCAPHEGLLGQWREKYAGEGKDETTAAALAEAATGPAPLTALPHITIPYQRPNPRFLPTRQTTVAETARWQELREETPLFIGGKTWKA